jgi:peptidoglycan/LPS O-acetylase OafA/YrhL
MPTPRRRFEVPQINTIRVLAMLAIFWHHLWKGVPKPVDPGLLGSLVNTAFEHGALGVIIFNCMTGFVLSLSFLGPAGNRTAPSYSDFLRRRFLRIIPQYYLSVLLFVAVNALITGNRDLGSILWTIGERLLFIQNLDYDAFMSNIAAFWWLGLLAQFYLLFPLVLRLFLRFGPVRACLGLCAVCWSGLWVLSGLAEAFPGSGFGAVHYLIYFSIPARLPEFAMGMWLAAAWRPEEAAPAGQLILPFSRELVMFFLGAVLLAVAGMVFPLPLKTLPLRLVYQVACCLALFIACFSTPWFARTGGTRLMTNLAGAAYSVYLVHQPLLSYANMLLGERLGTLGQFVLLTVAVGALCYGLARVLDLISARMFASGAPPAGARATIS